LERKGSKWRIAKKTKKNLSPNVRRGEEKIKIAQRKDEKANPKLNRL